MSVCVISNAAQHARDQPGFADRYLLFLLHWSTWSRIGRSLISAMRLTNDIYSVWSRGTLELMYPRGLFMCTVMTMMKPGFADIYLVFRLHCYTWSRIGAIFNASTHAIFSAKLKKCCQAWSQPEVVAFVEISHARGFTQP